MKRIFISGYLLLSTSYSFAQTEPAKETKDSFYILSPVEVRAVRAGENTPFAKTNLSQKEISKNNLGQDIPFLLNQTPSVVINADAGNGIGYTGIRIRGSDATRINVTWNGIPYNDPESQGTFFVDLPDLASSTSSIQVQRGVGTSSNGAGAFGGSINFSTNEINKDAFVSVNNSYGSFNSWKNTLIAGTGLHKGFTSELRLSHISSDGYIDRAFSKLRSLGFTTAYIGKTNSLRLNIFTGQEKTYQAWYGISQLDLDGGNRTKNYAGTEKPGEPYDNETDNYTQSHYQLFFNQQLGKKFHFNTALFYTKGKGYYEQYKTDQDYANYGLPYPVVGSDTIFLSDFIRQLWLNNDYYGNIFSFQFKSGKTEAVLGGAITHYVGNHYGILTWASKSPGSPHRWYDLDALKTDFNIYLKEQTEFTAHWSYYYDLQYRHVKYNIDGFRYNPSLVIKNKFNFFNPKAGIVYKNKGWKAFLSIAFANKEPNRDDFEAGAGQQPKPERLQDWEAGIETTANKWRWALTFFYMRYKDQLVLTGKINDVGAYTRTNIPKSYRAGIELETALQVNKWMNVSANFALSRNKIMDFIEFIDDYDNGVQIINKYSSTDIAYSPSVVGAASINLLPVKNIEISLLGKYVSRQYLDNTQTDDRILHSFYVQDIRATYSVKRKIPKELNIILQVNNVFGMKYEPNGYTYSYIYGGTKTTENYYFPMAGVNFMAALNFRF